jgi:hypothetical protein
VKLERKQILGSLLLALLVLLFLLYRSRHLLFP